MDNPVPSFIGFVVLVIIVIGAGFYFGSTEIHSLQSQVTMLRSQVAANATATMDAKAVAQQAKDTVDGETASLNKVGDLSNLVKQASDSADAAAKSAEEAKGAAGIAGKRIHTAR